MCSCRISALLSPGSARYAAAPFQLGDYWIPQGWGLVVPAQILHRNPDAFPQPDDFLPERWLAPGMGLLCPLC